MLWWTLPGPLSFIEAVADDIREGKSVFLCLPEHTSGRLATQLERVFEGDFGWLPANVEAGVAPIDFLYELTAPEADPAGLRNPANLAREAGFSSKILWLEDIQVGDWPAWTRFFAEYERVCRSVPEARRSYFVVRMFGPNAILPLPDGVGLSVRRWDGWLRRQDLWVYSSTCVREKGSGLETDLVVALVSVLGGWDPALCDHLTNFELVDLLRPADLLRDFAIARGWRLNTHSLDDEAWGRGLWQTYLGNKVPHTCYAAFLNGSRYLDRLIWRAEIGVLMPYIEEKRQKLIDQYRGHFRLPHYTKTGVIEDVYDLEIGMIEWMLSRSGAVTKPVLDYISALKGARNRLSHLCPVDPDLLLGLCRNAREER